MVLFLNHKFFKMIITQKLSARQDIVQGPEKKDFFDSLSEKTQITISTVPQGIKKQEGKIPMHYNRKTILSFIQAEDGSRESWNFEGVQVLNGDSVRVKGHYNTKTRKGTLQEVYS